MVADDKMRVMVTLKKDTVALIDKACSDLGMNRSALISYYVTLALRDDGLADPAASPGQPINNE